MVDLARREAMVCDDRERRARFERMWRDAAAAAAAAGGGVDAVDDDGVPALDGDTAGVRELLDADPTELAWWWR